MAKDDINNDVCSLQHLNLAFSGAGIEKSI